MKITKLITKLTEIQQQHGDVSVGFKDCEIDKYVNIERVEIRKSNRLLNEDGLDWYYDEKELGHIFVGIS